jgi:hypothetical protein
MLNEDYRDMLSEFDAAGVEYLIVGAFAVAAHGLPRATGDMDLWVRPTPENSVRVMEALRLFGAPLNRVTERDFATPGVVFQIGVAPRRIDILTCIAGVTFDDAWASRLRVEVEDVPVNVLSKEHLLVNKRIAGRPKDRADVRALERRSRRRG